MVRAWCSIVQVLLIVLAFSGCQNKPDSSGVSGTVRVRLPYMDSEGHESFEERTLTGVEDLSVMKTRYAEFFYAPKIAGNHLEGPSVHMHFVKLGSGVWTPTDETSKQVTWLAAQIEDLHSLDDKVGMANLLKWPASIGYGVKMKADVGQVENNSFYEGNSDSILFVPFEDGHHLPLSLNHAVIAHEHFHAIFQNLIINSLLHRGIINPDLRSTGTDDKAMVSRIERTVFVKSINEGLADVWGWIYSGDLQFVARSLPSQSGLRNLDFTLKSIDNSRGFLSRSSYNLAVETRLNKSNSKESTQEFATYAYIPGNTLAKAVIDVFRGDAKADSLDVRMNVANRIIKALPRIADEISLDETRPVDFISVLNEITAAAPMTDDQTTRAKAWSVEK